MKLGGSKDPRSRVFKTVRWAIVAVMGATLVCMPYIVWHAAPASDIVRSV